MATKRQKDRKKKDREQKAKARVEYRRHKIREARKDEVRARRLELKFSEKQKPFVKNPEKRAEMEAAEQEKAKQRIERNMQILKALEEEYEAEQNRKRDINRELEAQGHETLKEKLNAMEEIARAAEGNSSALTSDT